MMSTDTSPIIPKLVRQNGVCDGSLLGKMKRKRGQIKSLKPLVRKRITLDKAKTQKKAHNQYRWVWMMKNGDELVWREYLKSPVWFDSYIECRKSALLQITPDPDCAAVRLFIEIRRGGLTSVIEILRNKNSNKETRSDDDEGGNDDVIRYKWEWRVCYPTKENVWQPHIKSDKWFNTFKECKEDGKNYEFDAVSNATLKLCVQVWHDNECIIETYFKANEL